MSRTHLSRRIGLLGVLLSACTLSLTAGQSIPAEPTNPIEFQLTDEPCLEAPCDEPWPGPIEPDVAHAQDFDLLRRSFQERQRLTGDWRMWRPYLQEAGVEFRGTLTQFAFGIEGGVNAPIPPLLDFPNGDRFSYSGRGEYDWIFDLGTFGGKPGGKLLIGVQHWYGQFG
ncbi:MAG: hypothetical protein AAGF97_19720, partial [Planctomycetota bacterium]